MTPKEDTMTKEFIDDKLKKGFIRPSKSPMATPFFFVHKKGTTKKRPCQDYQYLNTWTVKNAYPLVPSFPISWAKSRMQNISRRWTYN